MKPWHCAFWLLAVSLLPAFPSGAEESLVRLTPRVRPAVVTVINYSTDREICGVGSGFFIDARGSLITNFHVVQDAAFSEIKTHQGKKYPVSAILWQDRDRDLVKLGVTIPAEEVTVLPVSAQDPTVAEPVLVVGSPLGLEQTVSEGIVSAIRRFPEGGIYYQITAAISPGSSGSPVLNLNGQVVGVATLQAVNGQNLNFAVPGKYILQLDQRARTGRIKSYVEPSGTIVITDQ